MTEATGRTKGGSDLRTCHLHINTDTAPPRYSLKHDDTPDKVRSLAQSVHLLGSHQSVPRRPIADRAEKRKHQCAVPRICLGFCI